MKQLTPAFLSDLDRSRRSRPRSPRLKSRTGSRPPPRHRPRRAAARRRTAARDEPRRARDRRVGGPVAEPRPLVHRRRRRRLVLGQAAARDRRARSAQQRLHAAATGAGGVERGRSLLPLRFVHRVQGAAAPAAGEAPARRAASRSRRSTRPRRRCPRICSCASASSSRASAGSTRPTRTPGTSSTSRWRSAACSAPTATAASGFELSYLTPLPWYAELVGSMTHDSALEISHAGNLQGDGGAEAVLLAVRRLVADVGPVGHRRVRPERARRSRRALQDWRHRRLSQVPAAVSGGSYTIVSLQAEWFYRRRDVVLVPPAAGRETLHDTGGFAALFWRFAQRWAAAARWELGTPSRNGAGVVTPHCGVGRSDVHRHRVHRRRAARVGQPDLLAHRVLAHPPAGRRDAAGGRAGYRVVGLTAFEFAVGAHGAHAF